MENKILQKEIHILKLKNKLMGQDLKKMELVMQKDNERADNKFNGEYTEMRVANSFTSSLKRMNEVFGELFTKIPNPNFLNSLKSFLDDTCKILAIKNYSFKIDQVTYDLGILGDRSKDGSAEGARSKKPRKIASYSTNRDHVPEEIKLQKTTTDLSRFKEVFRKE